MELVGGGSWIEFELNRTETRYMLDVSLSFLDASTHSSQGEQQASLATVQGSDNSLLTVVAQKNSPSSELTLLAKFMHGSDAYQLSLNKVPDGDEWIHLRFTVTRFHFFFLYNSGVTHNSEKLSFNHSFSVFNFTKLSLGNRGSLTKFYPFTSFYPTCFSDLLVNDVPLLSMSEDLHALHQSGDVMPGCDVLDPCSKTSCARNSECVVTDGMAFCIEQTGTLGQSGLQGDDANQIGGVARKPSSTQILQTLEVDEGSKVQIQVMSINLPENTSSKNVFFNVTRAGTTSLLYGSVVNKNDKKLTIFNFEPARSGNIFYQHNGGESSNDKIIMQMLLRTQYNTFQPGSFVYIPVTIKPLNDMPELLIDWDLMFFVERNSRRPLTRDVITVQDSDSSSNDLKIFVMSVDQNLSEVSVVRKEADRDGRTMFQKVSAFTYQNVLDGDVFVQHHSSPSGNRVSSVTLELQVADLKSFGNKAFLTISIVDVSLHVINERLVTITSSQTPLVLTEDDVSIAIYPQTEALFVSADQGRLKYLEEIINFTVPTNGQLEFQTLDTFGRWNPTSTFTQLQLRSGNVRMRYLEEVTSSTDTGGYVTLYARYKVLQQIIRLNYIIKKQSFDISVSSYFRIEADVFTKSVTQNDLSSKLKESNVLHTVPLSQIMYTITRLPKYFDLYINTSSPSISSFHLDPKQVIAKRSKRLQAGSKFTQFDVDNEHLFLQRKMQSLIEVTDDFKFNVEINSLVSPEYGLQLNVAPIKNSNFRFEQKNLAVLEGEEVVLTTTIISVFCDFSDNFFFYIINQPKHGVIQVVETRMKQLIAFSYGELKRGMVSYVHDGSETTEDSVDLALAPITIKSFTSKDGAIYNLPISNVSFSLNVSISLVSDNKPKVVANRIINTTYDSMILLTPDILYCHDPDIDENDDEIQYKVDPNDATLRFFNCKTPNRPLSQFKQAQISEFVICLQQRANIPNSHSVIRAGDSRNELKSSFEVLITIHIRLVEPYLFAQSLEPQYAIEKTSRLKLDSSTVHINSSIYLDPSETFISFQKPTYGKIFVNDTAMLEEFSYYNFLQGWVFYEHVSSASDVVENLQFGVVRKDLRSDFNVTVVIKKDILAPVVVTLQTIHVVESKNVTLTEKMLSFHHDGVDSSQIEYLIVETPHFVDIVSVRQVLYNDPFKRPFSSTTSSLSRFTQKDLESGVVVLLSTIPGHVNDSFQFNVTNGLRVVGPFTCDVIILPGKVSLLTKEVIVDQGSSFALSSALKVLPVDYADVTMSVSLIQSPVNGMLLTLNSSKCMRCRYFHLDTHFSKFSHFILNVDISRKKFTYLQFVALFYPLSEWKVCEHVIACLLMHDVAAKRTCKNKFCEIMHFM